MYSFLRMAMFIFVSDEIDKTQIDIVMKKITKLLLFLLVALSLPQLAHAQGWTRTYNKMPLGIEPAMRMTRSANNRHVLAGPYAGGYFLMAIDSLGNEIWHQAFATASNATVRSVKTLSTGEIVVFGFIASSGTGLPSYSFMAKHSTGGSQLWFQNMKAFYVSSGGHDMVVLPNDTLLIGGHILDSTATPIEYVLYLEKRDANGDSIDMRTYQDMDTLGDVINVITLTSNNTIVAVGKGSHSSSETFVYGFDLNLNKLWGDTADMGFGSVLIPTSVLATSDGGYLHTGYELITGQPNGLEGNAYLIKTDNVGSKQWIKHYHLAGDISQGQGLAEPTSGKYVVMAMGLLQTQPSTYYSGKPYLVFTDVLGNVLNHKVYKGPSYISVVQMRDIALLDDKGFLMCGSTGEGEVDKNIYLIRTDSLGNTYQSIITGNVFGDDNENCQKDNGEPKLKQWIINATNGTSNFYGVTDGLGNYEITCDTGTYTLKAVLPSAYWVDTLCSDSLTAVVLTTTDTLTKNIPVGKTIDCPAMHVSVDAPFLRRCLPGPAYMVSYCNKGTAESTNTYTEISLDSDLVLDSASVAYISLGNNRYRFDIGTVGITDCGSFIMYIRVDCSVALFGQSHCVEADIFPNTVCTPPSPLWDMARLDLTTDCQSDSLAFLIINNGSNMSVPRAFTIIQDDVMYAHGNFNLNNLQTFTYKVPSNGSTWTFVTEQTPFFPGNKHLVGSVEGCGTNNSGIFSLGYLVQFPQIGPDPSSAGLCLIDRASYDPNDKAVEPKGLGLEGTIDSDQSLNYRIRFQNTGTDTAFLVVVLDTLSDNLDLLSIRNVRSSHPMQMSILPGRILQFVFANILLPDSNVNELASHGYISFDIDLLGNIATGTEITNTAFIYFDQNAAVVTNTTLNTIGELFKTWLTVSDIVNPENRVAFYPNPTQGALNFSVDGFAKGLVEVSVISIQGQQMHNQQFDANMDALQMDLSNLPMGVYLLKVNVDGQSTIHRVVVAH
jgi:uncharacterized repeat protein (TIGR01451 family)